MQKLFEGWRKFLKEAEEGADVAEKVRNAIDNTSPEYMEKSLKQRNPGAGSAGSTFETEQTVESLKSAKWIPLKHNPEAIKSPAIAFEAPIAGKLGAADITTIADDTKAAMQPAHGGKGIDRETGKLMAELIAVLPDGQPKESFTTIILGPSQQEPEKLTVWTFHPGAPISSGKPVLLDDMKKKFNSDSDIIPTTVGEAKKLGFQFVKHVDSLPSSGVKEAKYYKKRG